ncbi:hypothetical protein [Polaribacter atrinae]|uniref:hypothetical protein n=1 Tax=Polaribacter atrinae TaxID=1333662 RepID=UPI000AEFEBE4|nr:hypothetical protein [Polaribacter atrinae]
MKNNWVEKPITIYIGKSDGIKENAILRNHLKQYLRLGQGFNIGHYGGQQFGKLKIALN